MGLLIVCPVDFGICISFGSNFKQFATSHPVAELRTVEEATAAVAELKEVDSTNEQISESDGVEVAVVEETESAPKAKSSTNYFLNSTGSSATHCWFSPIIG